MTEYLNHSIYEEFKIIDFEEKCKFCGISLKDISDNLKFFLTIKEALDLVPCLTENEFIIKSIIE